MSVTFAEVIAGIETASQVASAVKTIASLTYEAAEAIYSFTKDAITTAETAYGDSVSAGGSKLEAVLAAVEAFVEALGVDWSSIKTQLQAFIEGCISLYNTLIAGISSVKDALTGDSTSSDDTASDTAADTTSDDTTSVDTSTDTAADTTSTDTTTTSTDTAATAAA